MMIRYSLRPNLRRRAGAEALTFARKSIIVTTTPEGAGHPAGCWFGDGLRAMWRATAAR